MDDEQKSLLKTRIESHDSTLKDLATQRKRCVARGDNHECGYVDSLIARETESKENAVKELANLTPAKKEKKGDE